MPEKENFIDDKFSIDQLLKQSFDYLKSDAFIKFIDFIASFDHYSRYNVTLVHFQNRAVTFFGGHSFWRKKFNRTVNKGAKPHVILVPNGPVMMVYDIFDTTGEESPEEFIEKGLGRKPLEVKGEFDPKRLSFAIRVAQDYGIKVAFKPLSYFNAAYVDFTDRDKPEIYIKEGLSPAQSLSFLIHELAHLFLGHTGQKELVNHITVQSASKKIYIAGRDLSVTARELEAETCRYLLCYKMRLETRSAEYMAHYIKSDDDLIQFSYENVIKTADKIEKLFL
jgi:hypothetical protein